MREVFQLVGETAAQSIQNVSGGDALIPLLTTVDKYGHADYMCLAMEDSADALRFGHDKLERNDDGKIGAVFVADGFITMDDGKTDALVVEVRVYSESVAKCQMVIPYRPAKSVEGFAIHRPQVTLLENIEQTKFQPLLDAFFAGIETHKEGGKIWNEYYTDDVGTNYDAYASDKFDAEQWNAMLAIPCQAFLMIAGDDIGGRAQEIRILDEIFSASAKYQSPLLQTLCKGTLSQADSILTAQREAGLDYSQALQESMNIVESNFSAHEVKGLKIALLAMAKDVAHVSSYSRGLDGRLSDAGKMALARLVFTLQVNLDA